jgi:inositol phosphorylceramide mannosyltransferase catalytic subunit
MTEPIEIPTFIKSDIIGPYTQKIPKTIIQTYNKSKIHPFIYSNIMEILKRNPEYDYRLITDNDGIFLIKKYFTERVLNAFKQLTLGAAKGDFIRYIVLYLYGGVYLDLDASIDLGLNTLIDRDAEFIFFINGDANLEQFCFMIKPRHVLMEKIIEEMVTRIENKEPSIFIATGPTLFNDVIYNTMNNTNIYDTTKCVTNDDRAECYSKNNQFMGGKIVLRHGNDMEEKITFRIKDSEKMIYDDNENIRYCMYDPSSEIHYIHRLF